jgi:hypothetical protein
MLKLGIKYILCHSREGGNPDNDDLINEFQYQLHHIPQNILVC